MEPKTTVLEIGSWISASNDANFSDTHPVTSSVHDFYSLPGTSLYTTIVDILLPATKAQLPCLSRDELYHSVGPPLSGGEGSQFETFSSHIRKLPSQTKQISTIIKCIRRRKEDYASGTANRRISDIIRSLKDIMKEFQFLCHEPFRNHPNIVKLLAYGWEPDFAAPVLVLELADLGNLENYLKNTSSLSFDMKREICLDIAAGLDILHAAHVVHGDLKPRNILMFRKEKQGTQSVQAKLSDFGLSTGDLDRDEAAYNGTTLWNPPEAGEKTRIRAQDLSSCDIFSLGLIIWTVLKQGEDYMDGAWFPPSTDDRFQKVLDSALLPRFRGLSLEHIKNMKPCFRRNEDDAKEALAVKNLGSNGLLKQASQYLDAIDISRSEIFGGDPEILKQCFAQAFDGTLQDDPKARKSAAEIMKILDISNMRSSVPRDFTAQDYKLVAYDKQESSFILLWNGRLSLKLPYDVQKELRTELERLASASESVNPNILLDLTLFYLEGIGGPIESEKLMSTLRKAAAGGNRPAAGLFVRLGGPIDFTEHGAGNEYAQMNPEVVDNALKFLTPIPGLGDVEEQFFIRKLRMDFTNDRVRKAPKALETAQNRPLIPGDYYYRGVHALEIGDVCNRWLHYFIHQGDVESLTHLLTGPKSSHFSFNGRNMDIETPLLVASRYGLDFAVVALLALGADPKIANPAGVTPLHFLSMFEDDQIPLVAEFMLKLGADLHATGMEYCATAFAHFWGTPLNWAVQMRCITAVNTLLEHGADINDLNGLYTPLEIATELFLYDVVDVLLDNGAMVHHPIKDGDEPRTPCFHSIAVARFLAHSVISKRLMHGRRLPKAVDLTIQAYLKRGYTIDERDSNGNTALLCACMNPDPNNFVLESLVGSGASLSVVNNDGRDVIGCVILGAEQAWGSDRTAQAKLQLLAKSIEHNDKRELFNYWHLCVCASKNLPLLLKTFLEAHVDPNGKVLDDSPWNPLGSTKKYLPDHRLLSALHTAAVFGNPLCVRVLLDFNANINALSGWDGGGGVRLTPLAIAVMECHIDVVDELMKDPLVDIWLPVIHGERPSVLNLPHFYQRNTLHMRTKMVTHLLWNYQDRFVKAEVLTATLAGFNPLHGAIAAGDDRAVRRLLEAGVDPNIPAMVDEDNPFSRPQDSVKTSFEEENGDIKLVSLVDEKALSTRLPKSGKISCLDLALVLRHIPKHFLAQEATPDWLKSNLLIITQLLDAGACVSLADFHARLEEKDFEVIEVVGQCLRKRGELITKELSTFKDDRLVEHSLSEFPSNSGTKIIWALPENRERRVP